ncbi:glycerate kinase family protein [Secundilactobacillus paracollinoides]|uniref:Glycerate kinase n=1 Tax=Secundilactobacillus paracollinoides TaxID=240427 RepID=A0A1B2J127_9LACO|nr:glycerate kinase [Secundilactobacillus paracollinoides]ANZ62013.1 glycerate kinase [Secundilactobacillus paracollinoides]ANZ67959.1 glycerate kinase [Secundilactobacillus paracollinoides]
MKIVIAPDSFKGGMTAKQAADAIETGVKRVFPESDRVKVPMADGGEGTVQALVDATGGTMLQKYVTGPLGKPIATSSGLLGDHETAVIEMAAASGLEAVPVSERNPSVTTTYGTGELILAAMDQGVKRIIIGIGGSATVDGGAGMAQALGVHLLDETGTELQVGGGQLGQLTHIDITGLDHRIQDVSFLVASDVTNPLIGENGAAAVFGPQKGATSEMVKQLDRNLAHFAQIIEMDLGVKVGEIPGAGAAGGLGAGLIAFLRGHLQPGIDLVIRFAGLRERAQDADLVFTGEGQVDFQTQYGKTPLGVAQTTKAVAPHAPVIVLTGNVGSGTDVLFSKGIDAIFPIEQGVTTLTEALNDGAANLTATAEQVARVIAQTRWLWH